MSELNDRLELALDASAQAAELILGYYGSSALSVESKSDESPVTVADREAELLMRKLINESFPDDGVLGEEHASKPSTNGYRWVLDPIDGTKPFIYSVPLFGTLVGIELNGRMVAGVCRMPALEEVVWAGEGTGAFWKRGQEEAVTARVSKVSDLSAARVMMTDMCTFNEVNRTAPFANLVDKVRMVRGWGDCYGHILVATGRAEVAADPVMSPWDIAALIPILRESGGSCTDWSGNEDIEGGSGVSVNAALRNVVMQTLQPA